jgi:hypothetical protein
MTPILALYRSYQSRKSSFTGAAFTTAMSRKAEGDVFIAVSDSPRRAVVVIATCDYPPVNLKHQVVCKRLVIGYGLFNPVPLVWSRAQRDYCSLRVNKILYYGGCVIPNPSFGMM